MIIRGHDVELRALTREDGPRVLQMLAHPEVASRWGDFTSDPSRLERDFLADTVDEVPLAICHGDEVIGVIQYGEENEPDYRHASIDLFLDGSYLGRGLGTAAVRALATYLFVELGHHRITIDPAADNERAIGSYLKVGFRPVGVMRRYERGPDGRWHDNLLMDLLPTDLT